MRRPPQLRAGEQEHRHASWLELFLDLVLIEAISVREAGGRAGATTGMPD